MQKQILGGVVTAVLLTGGVLAAPAVASAAPAAHPVSATATTAAAPVITVTTPEAFLPETRVTIRGTATPNSDVYLSIVGANVLNEQVRSDGRGNWSYTTRSVLSGNLAGNSAFVVAPDGRWAQTTFDLTGVYPQPTHAEAALRALVVSGVERTGASSARLSGTATPGAVVYVRSAGWSQGVAVVGDDGRWSTTITIATAPGEGSWPAGNVVYQDHASGSSRTTFAIPS
ncbi:hypothetical protein [Curtobacterium sp. DN_7.5]|uniref:hypothetical protein n=1 Tax=Curtobacterium sp. DN_7.5 TaxID=3049047 RepID=UPI001F59FF4B|nr:hypothetical protein [Curtobacterium sp. DN_7.5]